MWLYKLFSSEVSNSPSPYSPDLNPMAVNVVVACPATTEMHPQQSCVLGNWVVGTSTLVRYQISTNLKKIVCMGNWPDSSQIIGHKGQESMAWGQHVPPHLCGAGWDQGCAKLLPVGRLG